MDLTDLPLVTPRFIDAELMVTPGPLPPSGSIDFVVATRKCTSILCCWYPRSLVRRKILDRIVPLTERGFLFIEKYVFQQDQQPQARSIYDIHCCDRPLLINNRFLVNAKLVHPYALAIMTLVFQDSIHERFANRPVAVPFVAFWPEVCRTPTV